MVDLYAAWVEKLWDEEFRRQKALVWGEIDLSLYVIKCHNCGSKRVKPYLHIPILECKACAIDVYPLEDLKLKRGSRKNEPLHN